MAYYVLNAGADTDLTVAKGKRLRSWHISNITAAAVINFRNGSVSGDIVAQIQLAIGTSASQAYDRGNELMFPQGLFVDHVSGTITGSVDLE